jgi:hypothetical protein
VIATNYSNAGQKFKEFCDIEKLKMKKNSIMSRLNRKRKAFI